MTTISLLDAQAKLPELVRNLAPDEELVITDNDLPVARLTPTPKKSPRQLGTLKGTVLYMAPDFDAPLKDFQEYME